MKVYVDMDGVLADFFSAALKLSPAPVAAWRDMEYRDVQHALNQIRVTPQFFENLDMYPGARTLIQSIVNLFGEYHICSSPMEGYEDCEVEKIMWLTKHMDVPPASIEITTNKPQFADGNVLIDDYGLNIMKWESAGGYGIKYQADENHLSDALIPLMTLARKQP